MKPPLIICVDFDGTIVEHCYPDIGAPVPGAIDWLRKFAAAGAKLILWTMRSDGLCHGPTLTQAVEYIRGNGIELYSVNNSPGQSSWTSSPKAYAHLYIDDAAACCPLRDSPRVGGRKMVDWEKVGPVVMAKIEGVE